MKVEFWFDFSCPYAYLGSTQIGDLAARLGVEIDWKPMLLGGVFRARAVPQRLFAALSEAKARHNALDLVRWSERFGVPYAMPDGHPFRSVEALRALLAVGPPFAPLAHAFYRAYWVEGRDVGARAVLEDVLTRAGHDAAAVLARAAEQRIKDELFARTDEAIRRGIFGAPTMFVGDEMFWGQDRLDDVEAAITGRALSRAAATTEEQLELYFDLACPHVALAMERVLSRAPRARLVPVSLDDLLVRQYPPSGELPAQSEAKTRYLARDLARRGPKLRLDAPWPRPSTRAALGLLALVQEEAPARLSALSTALARAAWEDGEDVDDPAALLEHARPLGLEAWVSRAVAGEGEGALAVNTSSAERAGVFGVPTLVRADGAVFFGEDRVELALG